MKQLDITTIVNRVRDLSNASPVLLKGLGDEHKELDASIIAATIVGGAIGTHCPIPASPKPVAVAYFASAYGNEVREVLSRINESVNIRTQVAYDAAVTMWSERYAMVHKPVNLDVLMMRLALSSDGDYENSNFARPLLSSLDDKQREALSALVKSINLSCSEADIRNTFLDK